MAAGFSEPAFGDQKGCAAMTTTMWMMLGIGGFLGTFVGRWWAELRRARYDMDRIWHSRRNYRG